MKMNAEAIKSVFFVCRCRANKPNIYSFLKLTCSCFSRVCFHFKVFLFFIPQTRLWLLLRITNHYALSFDELIMSNQMPTLETCFFERKKMVLNIFFLSPTPPIFVEALNELENWMLPNNFDRKLVQHKCKCITNGFINSESPRMHWYALISGCTWTWFLLVLLTERKIERERRGVKKM